MSSSDGASEVYGKLLLLEKLGYPLWYPDLDENLSNEYRDQGVRIGDVGIITGAGQFDFQFNVHEDNRAFDGILPWPIQEASSYPNMRGPKTAIKRGAVKQVDVGADVSLPTSASIGAAMEFTCSCNESAILVLPDGASDTNMKKPKRFLDLLTADVALQWLDAAESSSLILVTGCVKSRSWGVASVSNTSGQAFVSLNFSAAQVGGQFTGSYSWQSSNGGHHRDGPHPPSDTQNQCVFMRGFKISSRKSLIPGGKRVAITDVNGSKIHDLKRSKRRRNRLSGSSHSSTSGASQGSLRSQDSCADAEGQKSDDDEIFIEEFVDVSQPYHPLDTINHYLLNEFPDARVAVTHDEDWCVLIEEADNKFPSENELLHRVRRKYTPVLESGFVTLMGIPNKRSKNASPFAVPSDYSVVSCSPNISLHEFRQQDFPDDIDKPMLHVQVGRMPRMTRNPAPPRLDTRLSPVQKSLASNHSFAILDVSDHTGTMKIHCHPKLGDCSPDSGGSWIRPGKVAQTTDTVQTHDGSQAMSATLNTPLTSRNYTTARTALGYLTQRERDEVDNESCVSSSVFIDTVSNHDANLDSTRPRTETAITAHSFDVSPHPTSLLGSPTPSDSKQETVAEIRSTEDTPTLFPPASPQTDKLNELWPLLYSGEQSTLQFDANGKKLHPLPSSIPAVVDLPLATHLDVETSRSKCTTPPTVDGVTNPDNIWNGEAKLSQQHATSSSPVDNDVPTTSLTADDQSPLVQTGHVDLGDVIKDPRAPMQDECDIQKEEQMNTCIQEPETLTTSSIPESGGQPRFVGNDNDNKQLEQTPGTPFFDEILDSLMSKSKLASTDVHKIGDSENAPEHVLISFAPVQDSSAGQLNKNPLIADPGGINLGVPTSSTTLPESPALKVTNYPTSFDHTSRINSQSKSDTAALSAATTPSASTAFHSGREITGSNIEADSAQGGLDYISIDCQAECEIATSNITADSGQEQLTSSEKRQLQMAKQKERHKLEDKLNKYDTKQPSSHNPHEMSDVFSKFFDFLSSHPYQGDSGTQTMQDGASCSNKTDGVSPTSRMTENRDRPSATFGRRPQTTTTSNRYQQGSILASKDASDRRGLTPGILKTNIPTTFIPKSKVTLVDLVGQSEQNDLSVLSVTSGSSPITAPHKTADGIGSPILPPLPRSYADFGDVLHLLSPDNGDIRTERIPVSTSHLTNPLEPRAQTEVVISPTRTLFPSVSQNFEMTEQVIMPQNDMTRARAASLRFHNKRLEDECDEWRQRHDELEREHRELEKKCKDLEKGLADLAAVGAEWF